jgi:hypothetical protein
MIRPFGITILSTLLTVGGLLMLASMWEIPVDLPKDVERVGFLGAQPHAATAFIGILGVAGGVGMFCGKRWGWWLGSILLWYSAVIEVSAIHDVASIARRHAVPALSVGLSYAGHLGEALIAALLSWYLFSNPVSAYFQFPPRSKSVRCLFLFGATTASVGFLAATGFLYE